MSTFHAKFDTLPQILEASLESYADRQLFGVKTNGTWNWLTYGDFGELVARARAALASLGVGKGDVVGIISANRPEWAVAAYAAYGLGAIVVPMYEEQHDDAWKYILNDSGTKVAFVAGEAIDHRVQAMRSEIPELRNVIVFDGGDSTGISYESFLDRGAAADVPVAALQPEDMAGFVYTSGTTGNPKGVLLSHGNFAHNVSAVTDVFPLEPDDRSLSFLPWAHAFGQTVELHGLLSKGASTAFLESVKAIVATMPEVKPTMLVSVPRVFNGIYDGLNKRMNAAGGIKKMLFDRALSTANKRRALAAEGKSNWFVDQEYNLLDKLVFSKVRDAFGGRLKYAISGGAAISMEVAEFIDDIGIDVYEGYGLSETSPIVTANWPGTKIMGSVGKPIPGVHVGIADPDPTTGDGEIVVYGHCVMQGYHNLPDKTAEVMTEDGGFRTGDLGRVDESGFLFITGRVKEQYKLENGKYVVPTPIEELISLSPYISSAMIYGANKPFNVALVAPDPEAVAAWAKAQQIELDDLSSLLEDDRVRGMLKKEIARTTRNIPSYERVKRFDTVDEDFTVENGMLTPTLKLKRQIVVDTYSDEIEHLYE